MGPGYPTGPSEWMSQSAGNASVTSTSPARFTIPPSTFTQTGQFVTQPTLTGISSVVVTKTLDRANGFGSFYGGFWPPSATYTQPANTTAFPNDPTNGVRNGIVRFTVGPNGFGGSLKSLRNDFYKTYRTGAFSELGKFGLFWTGSRKGMRIPGGYGPLGGTRNGMAGGQTGMYTRVPTSLNTTPITWTVTYVSTHAPWLTGMVTITIDSPWAGASASTFTLTGMDSRTPGGLGAISLVNPRLLFSYLVCQPGNPCTTGLEPLSARASAGRLTRMFLPEPARGALWAIGLFGLAALARGVRRRG